MKNLSPIPRTVRVCAGLALALAARALAAGDPDDAYRRALACLASNRFDEAAARFETATAATNPAVAASAWLGCGEAAFGAGKWEAAIRAYNALLAAYPQSPLAPNALCGRGYAQTKAEQLPEALDTFRALLARYPKHALAATAAASTGTLARTLAAQALRQETDALTRSLAAVNTLLRNRRHAEASAAAERALRAHPDCAQAADLLFTAADSAFLAGEWPRAETLFGQFLAQHPGHARAPQARTSLAKALDAQGRFSEAADAFARATDPDAPRLRAEALLKAKRFQDALAGFEALASASASPEGRARALLAAGDCHAALRQWPEAERAYLSVEVLQASDTLRPVALARLAALYEASGQTNLASRAREDLRRRYPDRADEPRHSPSGVAR